MTKHGGNVSNLLSEQTLNNKSRIGKKIDFDVDVARLIYRGVKSILEKDEYDIFATKSKAIYDAKIGGVSKRIDKTIRLNTSGKDQIRKLSSKLVKLKTENEKTLTVLREKVK